MKNQTVECLRKENRCLREKLYQIQELVRMTRQEVSVEESEYEPETYDEAIALCKGWKHSACAIVEGLRWKSTLGYTFAVPPRWETKRWPDLLKEMNEIDCSSGKSLDFSLTWNAYSLKWLCISSVYPFVRQFDKDGVGGAVCGAYLRLKGHKDWADRLCK